MLKPKILLVNDHPASLLALKTLLLSAPEADAYEVVTATSGAEALREVLANHFAVILLDVSMPGMDGFETAEIIHTHPRSAFVPIIFITAHYADEINKLKGYQRGAVDYLFTPIIPKILQTKVAVFVELAKKNLQLQHQTEQLAKLNIDLQEQRRLDLEHINERKQAEEALRQSQEELRQLASYQERIKEDERKRIAREIHDELGQNLLALRIDISMLHARTGSTHPKLNRKVHSVLDHIDSTMKAMRAIINNLRPAVLDLGLNAAIEWQVKEYQRRTGIECELVMQEEELMVDDNRATALFRILQESLNNVLRHAQATKARIELCKDKDRLHMKIADNGIGMFPGCRRKANSFGLVGIKERISTLGGELFIDTGQNRGTALTISLPMHADGATVESSVESRADVYSELAKLSESVESLRNPVGGTVVQRKKRDARSSKAAKTV